MHERKYKKRIIFVKIVQIVLPCVLHVSMQCIKRNNIVFYLLRLIYYISHIIYFVQNKFLIRLANKLQIFIFKCSKYTFPKTTAILDSKDATYYESLSDGAEFAISNDFFAIEFIKFCQTLCLTWHCGNCECQT